MNFEKCYQLGLPERPKYKQVEIMKHARQDVYYAILTKRVKLQHEKKPVLNLKYMPSVGLVQSVDFQSKIISLQEKNHSGNYLSGHH